MQSAFDRVAFLIGLAQVKTAMLKVTVLAVHLRHYIMEVAKIVGSHQADGNGGRGRLALENIRINLNGALVFARGAIKIFLREICAAQVAVEAGAVIVE